MSSQEEESESSGTSPSADLSSELSMRPSRQASTAVSTSNYIRDGMSSLISLSETRMTFEIMLDILRSSELPGPIFTMGQQTFLGQGSQFAVYEESVYWWDLGRLVTASRAVKHAKFERNLHMKFNMADSKARKHLQAICLEILALTHPEIRRHPNIVKLRAWTTERYYASPITLVVDLALYDLASFLKEQTSASDARTKLLFCVDIAAGLDQIHSCGFVHGDLKPHNVLIFEERGRLVAKLADFGFSIDDNEDNGVDIRIGGTAGWQAPEVEYGLPLSSKLVGRADAYSYGLLVWSTFQYGGEAPPQDKGTSRQQLARIDMENSHIRLQTTEYANLYTAIQHCLEPEPISRPTKLLEYFSGGLDVDSLQNEASTDLSLLHENQDTAEDSISNVPASLQRYYPFDQPRLKSWELAPLSDAYATDIFTVFSQNPEKVKASDCFALFLRAVRDPQLSYSYPSKSLPLLLEAARRGLQAARSMVPTMYRYFELEPPEEVTSNLQDWLKSAVADGCILGRAELERTDHKALDESIRLFQQVGGYNRIYSDLPQVRGENIHQLQFGDRWDILHYLASYGSVKQMKSYLKSPEEYDINALTKGGETALYLASLRGSLDIVVELLHHGSDPSIRCTRYKTTCLHWLFCFEEDLQAEVVAKFVSHGAEINASAEFELPFLHFPFVLPAGSPLHWAVVVSSRKAIEALVTNGADVLVRDGSNPYAFDTRIRHLSVAGGHDSEAYSIPKQRTMGLSPLDLSAMQYDPFIFQLLLSNERRDIDMNSVDEEGFSVLHRLSALPERRTRRGMAVSYAPFRGRRDYSHFRLLEVVKVVKKLGGNLDQFTKLGPKSPDRPSKRSDNYTPLMLAAMACEPDVVDTLLRCGAKVNLRNDMGITALHCITLAIHMLVQDSKLESCAEHLIAHGIDVNHRPSSDTSAVIHACIARKPRLVDILLSNGAYVEERSRHFDHGLPSLDVSLWALLARADSPKGFQVGHDELVAHLLEKHVYSMNNHDRIRRILEAANPQGYTMLHAFSLNSMSVCVRLVLSHEINPNQLYSWKGPAFTYLGTNPILKSFTPCDLAIICTATWKEKLISRRSWYSKEDYDLRLAKDREVIEALRSVGGKLLQVPAFDIQHAWLKDNL